MRMPDDEVARIKAIYEKHGAMALRQWAEKAVTGDLWDGDQQREILIDGAMERIRHAIKVLNKRGPVPWVLPARSVARGSEIQWKQPALFSYEEMELLLEDRMKQINGDMQELAMLLDLCQANFQKAPIAVMRAVSMWRSK